MFIPSYLSLSRHNIFYFRWPIPARKIGLRGYVHLSLGTRDPKNALRLARSMATLGDLLVRLNPELLTMDINQSRDIISTVFSEALKRFKYSVDKFGPRTSESLELLRQSHLLAKQSLKDNDDFFYPEIDERIGQIVESNGLSGRVSPSDLNSMKTRYIQATEAYFQDALQYNSDAEAINLSDKPHPLPIVQVNAVAYHSLVEVIEKFIDEKTRSDNWGAATRNARIAQLKRLTEFLGENYNLAELDINATRCVKEKLKKLPKNFTKKSSEVLSELSPADTLSVKTFNDYINCFGSFVGWAKNNGYCRDNFFFRNETH